MARKSESNRKPQSKTVYRAQERSCLMCQQAFTSTWPGERVCRKCKATAGWRSGLGS